MIIFLSILGGFIIGFIAGVALCVYTPKTYRDPESRY